MRSLVDSISRASGKKGASRRSLQTCGRTPIRTIRLLWKVDPVFPPFRPESLPDTSSYFSYISSFPVLFPIPWSTSGSVSPSKTVGGRTNSTFATKVEVGGLSDSYRVFSLSMVGVGRTRRGCRHHDTTRGRPGPSSSSPPAFPPPFFPRTTSVFHLVLNFEDHSRPS